MKKCLILLICPMISVFGANAQVEQKYSKPKTSRFQVVTPLPSLPPVTMDVVGSGYGAAQQLARSKDVQGRILWVDGTANLDKVNTEEKIVNLVQKIVSVGFNTIVFDVKPIVGYTLYPSKITSKLTTWRGQNLPANFDPLKFMVRECKKQKICLLVSMNAFSEGHRMAKAAVDLKQGEFGSQAGPGYEHPEQQTVLYEPTLQARVPFSSAKFPISPKTDSMPKNEDELTVVTRMDRAGKPPAGAFGVILDDRGVAVIMREGRDWDFKVVPENGSLLVGIGKGADFLRQNVRGGYGVIFESIPHFVRIEERPDQQIPLMMNPHHPQVQQRGLDFIHEVLTNYAVDGIMFDDRLRYGGLNADFSDITRTQFEKLVGEKLTWPDDVFTFTYAANLDRGVKPGKWFDAWMTFRAETMRNWVAAARREVQTSRPGSLFGVYAGSWFGEYSKYGSNYGSSDFNAGFS